MNFLTQRQEIEKVEEKETDKAFKKWVKKKKIKKPFIETFWKTFGLWVLIWMFDIATTYIGLTYYNGTEKNPISSFFLQFGWVTAITMSLLGIAAYCFIMGYVHKNTKNEIVRGLPLAFYIWLLGTQMITVIHNIIELNRLMNL